MLTLAGRRSPPIRGHHRFDETVPAAAWSARCWPAYYLVGCSATRTGQDPAGPHPGLVAGRRGPRTSPARNCAKGTPYHPAHTRTRHFGRRGWRLATYLAGLAADERTADQLATPDHLIGDLIGDIDPVKGAAGPHLGDPHTVHYGLCRAQPRASFVVQPSGRTCEFGSRWACSTCSRNSTCRSRGNALRLPLDC